MRGLDQYATALGYQSISARGAALVDCNGGEADKPYKRAAAFHALGYRVAVLRDDDTKPTPAVEKAFADNGGKAVKWRQGRALEDELFLSLTSASVVKLIDRAVELHGDDMVNQHIKSASQNAKDLNAMRMEALFNIAPESRIILGKAARTRRAGWFKSVTWMEDVARDIVGPDLVAADEGFKALVNDIFAWVSNAAA